MLLNTISRKVKLVTVNPMSSHMLALRHILQYFKGTLHYGFHLYPSSITFLLFYTHAYWSDFPDTSQSTSDYCVFLGDNLLSMSPKDKPHCSLLVLKLNVVELLRLCLSLFDYDISFLNFITLSQKSL